MDFSDLDPMSLYNPLNSFKKSAKRPDLSRSCLTDSVVPLVDCSNWVKFDDGDDHVHISEIRTHAKIPVNYGKGDQVVATTTLNPSDPAFLPLNAHEVLEVISVTDDGLLMACPATNRARTGLVNAMHVRKIRNTSLASTPVDRKISRIESTVLPRRPTNAPSTPIADYMNTEVQNQVWYMGCMERQESERKLKPMPNGTFLVRFSNNRQRYALSISYEGDVKHTIIEQSEEGKYFLDEGFVFNSIVELVNYYKVHNLCESFNSLNTVLKNPYRDCKVFRVIHDFSQEEAKFLSIKTGDILTLVDTIGEDRGWWKGSLNNRVGFFPLTYVKELEDEEDN